jgi:hypothetical protein
MRDSIVPTPTDLPFEFTDKPVTAWGGLRLLQEMTRRMGLRDALHASTLPLPGSNRGYDPVEMMEVFIACVWIGGNRFSHTALIRFDDALKGIFGWKRVAEVSTFTRFFHRFKREDVDRVFGEIGRWFWEQMPQHCMTLDLDSSVVTRYGEQEGVAIGYNPNKHGRGSHIPLFAFAADVRMVVNGWLRPGDTGNCNGSIEFTEESLRMLGDRHKVGLIRADAGFYDGKYLDWLEEKRLDYIVACKLMPALQRRIADHARWVKLREGVEVAEIGYTGYEWSKQRRLVLVRQEIERRPKALGKELFNLPGYKYQAYVTTLGLAPAEVWRLYRGRGDSENRIAELKHDFGMTGFCLDSFYATEAALRTVLLAYNLMSVFRQALLKAPQAVRLSTMRFQCFALGSWIGRNARKRIQRISLPGRRRPWFEGLFETISALKAPWPVPTPSS